MIATHARTPLVDILTGPRKVDAGHSIHFGAFEIINVNVSEALATGHFPRKHRRIPHRQSFARSL
jgi:hypothetical protein